MTTKSPLRRLPAAVLASLLSGSALQSLPAHAADAEVRLVIHAHQFSPTEVRVPAGQRVRLIVENLDATAEEFESYSLNREKVVPAGATVTVFIGPLKPGRYAFFGDFNPSTAQGVVVAQ